MTTTVTLRPSSTDSAGSWTDTGGAGSLHAATSDNSDSTYINNAAGGIVCKLNLDDLTLPAGAAIVAVQIRVRCSQASGSEQLGVNLRNGPLGTALTPIDYVTPTSTIQTLSAPQRLSTYADGPWTDAFIDGAVFQLTAIAGDIRVYAIYVDVLYDSAPTVTVTAPTEGSTVTNTSQPTVVWTFSDPDSDAEMTYEIAVFTAAQYGIGGFDPATSPATWRSGLRLGPTTSHQIGVLLANAVYRAYVRATDDQGNTSAWDYNQWTQNVAPPNAPGVVAVAETATQRVRLELTASATGLSTDYFQAERSIDGGATWVTLDDNIPVAGSPTTIYDYELPRNLLVRYRARGVRTVSGEPLAGAYGGTQIILYSDDATWLKSRTDPTLNSAVCHGTTRFASSSTEDMAVFEPDGRRLPVVMAGTIHAEVFDTLALFALDDDEWNALEALRALQEPLLLQTCFGDEDGLEQYWVRLGPSRTVTRITSYDYGSQLRDVTIGAREVAEPS